MRGHLIALYLDLETSEVAEEYTTLHEGISTFLKLTIGAQLVCNGELLATFSRSGWILHRAGVTRLSHEFMRGSSMVST